MMTTRILPAALAVALFAAGGVTHAFAADTGQRFHRGRSAGEELQMGRSIEQDQAMTAAPSKGELTFSQAEQKAEDRVGGGKVVASDRFGFGDDMYKFDIRKGQITKRVFVNGKTGTVEIAASLAPDIDPSIVGDPVREHRDDPNSA